MKIRAIFQKMLLIVALVTGVAYFANAQTTGCVAVRFSLTDSKFHVYFKPSTSGAQTQLNNGSLIALMAPSPNTLGTSISISSVTGSWAISGVNNTIGDNANGSSSAMAYWSVVLGNDPNITPVAGTEIELFNFSVSGACNGGSFDINSNPNTQVANGNGQAGTVLFASDNNFGADNILGISASCTYDGGAKALCENVPSLSCSGIALSPNVFTQGSASSANLTLNLTGITAGSYSFVETTASNFTTNPSTYSTSLTAGQSSVVIPISYDGGGSGSQTLTISMSGNNSSSITCPVTAVINAAAVVSVSNPTIPKTVSTNSGQQTGTASTEMNPSGATSYIYSIIACSPTPAGTTALPASSNLIMTNTNNGVYSYTTPTTAGTYSYCIKVCDANNSNNCATTTYTLNVSAVCNAGSVAPSVR